MCHRINCPDCGKPTFSGCGRHVEAVLGDVPPEDRCQGHAAKAKPGRPSWLAALLGSKEVSR